MQKEFKKDIKLFLVLALAVALAPVGLSQPWVDSPHPARHKMRQLP